MYRYTNQEKAEWPEGFKGCWECKQVLPFSDFHKYKKGTFGLYGKCKDCRKLETQASYSRQKQNSPELMIFNRAKSRAKKNGIKFSITLDDIRIPDVCPILGIPLVAGTGVASDSSPSLDRIFPELGYVSGNVLVMSNRANMLKNNATPEELLKVAAWSYKVTTSIKEEALNVLALPIINAIGVCGV